MTDARVKEIMGITTNPNDAYALAERLARRVAELEAEVGYERHKFAESEKVWLNNAAYCTRRLEAADRLADAMALWDEPCGLSSDPICIALAAYRATAQEGK